MDTRDETDAERASDGTGNTKNESHDSAAADRHHSSTGDCSDGGAAADNPENISADEDRASTTQAVTDRIETDPIRHRLDPQGVRDRLEARGEQLTRADAERAVERARNVGKVMDDAIELPGIGYRIGLDPIVGIAPVSGDAVAAAASLYIVLEGFRLGVPFRTLGVMLLLVGLDFVVGSIPIFGSLVDAFLKVNKRNAATLESYVDANFAPATTDESSH
jgi:hypothetical protein